MKLSDSLDKRDDRILSILNPDSELAVVGSGFEFTEGPVWDHNNQSLIFSDMPGNKMRKWTEAGGVESYRNPSNMANGNAYDSSGRLVTCEHATSRVTRTENNGEITVLASHYEGKELNSPNDIIVSKKGAIYFTDPTFGRMEYYGVLRECEMEVRGVYMIDDSGNLTLLVEDFDQPNGLCFSDDESKLFVNDSMKSHIRVFDVNSDGTLSGGAVWAILESDGEGVPDGMKIDMDGNMYCCGPGGIHILDSNGTSLGVIGIPEAAANFTWGESDMKSLFITASSSLYKIRVKIPGRLAY